MFQARTEGQDDPFAALYLEYLDQELDLIQPLLNPQRQVGQLHFGGGSPTKYTPRSGAVLQVLGTPTQDVFFTSYDNESLGFDTNPLPTTRASIRRAP